MKPKDIGISTLIYHGNHLEQRLDELKEFEAELGIIISRSLNSVIGGWGKDDFLNWEILQSKSSSIFEAYQWQKISLAGIKQAYLNYNKIFLADPFQNLPDIMSWIFSATQTFSPKTGLPIMPLFSSEMIKKMPPFALQSFSACTENVLSYSVPPTHREFSIIEIGFRPQELHVDLIETHDNNLKVSEKFIEFPPELYEAGRSILTYFGTYLEEQYGDQKAKVTIEQDDANKTLRMTVESETGDKKVIEKAYKEYALIMSGGEPPKSVKDNQWLAINLRSELRHALAKIEDYKDFNNLLKEQNENLLLTIRESLTKEQTFNINTSAESFSKANASASVEAHQYLSLAIGGVAELKELMPAGSSEAQELEQLEQGLESIAEEQDPKKVQRSPAMSKFQRILDDVASGEGNLAKAVRAAENGYSIFKKLAKTYNKVAPWCLLPRVPEELL